MVYGYSADYLNIGCYNFLHCLGGIQLMLNMLSIIDAIIQARNMVDLGHRHAKRVNFFLCGCTQNTSNTVLSGQCVLMFQCKIRQLSA